MTAKKKEKLSTIVGSFSEILGEEATVDTIREVAQSAKHPKCIQAIKMMVEYVEGLPVAKLEVGGKIELIMDAPHLRGQIIPVGEFEPAPMLLPVGKPSGSDSKGLPSGGDRHLEPGPSE